VVSLRVRMADIDPRILRLRIDFPCENCGRAFDAELHDFTPGETLQCPHCGWSLTMTDDFLQNVLRWVART
jgi:DNA-directed RNA polymerase subunit RPC12/RpoP